MYNYQMNYPASNYYYTYNKDAWAEGNVIRAGFFKKFTVLATIMCRYEANHWHITVFGNKQV